MMMPIWAFYFLGKAYLHFRGDLHLHVATNLLLMGFVLIPIRESRGLQWTRQALAVLAAFFSLWHDSWMRMDAVTPIAIGHWAASIVDPLDAAILVALLTLSEFAARRGFKPMAIALVAIAAVGVQNLGAASQRVNRYVDELYEKESSRVISLPRPAPGAPDFDVIVLHVDALSWDDLRAAARLRHPLLDRFDLLFTDFNSVSSYSLPADLRLLRAPCGQVAHSDLFKPWPKACSLFDALRARGFSTYSVLNAAPAADRWGKMRELGSLDPAMKLDGVAPSMIDYHGGPVFDDFEALQKWWQVRQDSGARRAALYYNTLSLDGGTHEAKSDWWRQSGDSRYLHSLDAFAADMDRFYALIQSSGRNAVVLLVPEFGRGLDAGSFSRDVPLPRFTLVPVGLKLIGQGHDPASFRQTVSAESVSYLSLAHLVAACLKDPPFAAAKDAAALLQKLPRSEFLAENESARVADVHGELFVFDKERKWIPLPANASGSIDIAKLRS